MNKTIYFSLNSAISLLNETEKTGNGERSYFGYGKNPNSFKVKLVRIVEPTLKEPRIQLWTNDKFNKLCVTEAQVLEVIIRQAEAM